MALFKRDNQQQPQEPTSLEQYYASQRRRNTLNWLLTIGVFVGSVVIVLGLVFGGRWVYRKVTNDNNQPSITQQDNANPQEEGAAPDNGQPDRQPAPSPASPPPASPPPATPPASSSTQPSPATPPPAPAPAPSPQPLPRTGDE